MSKYNNLFGAVLSTLVFSGAAIAHGVSNDQSGDVISGHSSDHKDSVLTNPTKAQAPEMGHSNEQNKEDMLHSINDHGEQIVGSPSSPPDTGHMNEQDKEDMLHNITEHK